MKSLTFSQFFALPPGTIFGQATGLPYQFSCGLFRKGESLPDDEDDCGRAIEAEEIILDDLEHVRGGIASYVIYHEDLEHDHQFLVYETSDLNRLTVLIGTWISPAAIDELMVRLNYVAHGRSTEPGWDEYGLPIHSEKASEGMRRTVRDWLIGLGPWWVTHQVREGER